MLIPLSASSSIDEIVAHVRATDQPEVELLVPNDLKALQTSAGCTILKHIVADSGAHVTLFTNDEKTQRAAQNAGLNVIAVDRPIVGPGGESGPGDEPGPSRWPRPATPVAAPAVRLAAPHVAPPRADSRALPSDTPPNGVATAVAPPSASDQAFLAGLQAFEQTLAPSPRSQGDEWITPEGAVLFDGDGDRGIGRQDAAPTDPWEQAFDDMGATMAQEPIPPASRLPEPDAATSRPAATPRASRSASTPPQRQTSPKGTGRSMFGDALASVFPAQRQAPAQPQGKGASPPAGTAQRGAQPRGFNPWIMVLIAALLLVGALIYTSGWLPIGTTNPTVAITPAAPPTEQQQFPNLVIPLTDAAPAEGAPQVQAAVLVQPVSTQAQGQAEGTTIAPIGRASGTLFLRNTLSQPVLVRAGTVVPAANGVQFTVDTDTTVSASVATDDGITFGRGEATLTARVPGAAGNIPAGSITSIPGYEGTLRVEQGAFSGGSDQEVRVVRPEDVNRVLPDALSRLYGTGTQSLQLAAAGRPGFMLVTETMSPTLESLQQLQGVDYAVFPPIGSVTSDGTFRLEVWATFNAVAEPADRPITSQLAIAARNLLVGDGRAAPDASVQVSEWTIAPQGVIVTAVVQPAGTAPVLPPELAEEIQRAIAGKPRAEAVEYLQGLVRDGRIAAFGSLPDWETIPERVEIVQAAQ